MSQSRVVPSMFLCFLPSPCLPLLSEPWAVRQAVGLSRECEGRAGSRQGRHCWPPEQGQALEARPATEKPVGDTGLSFAPARWPSSRPAGLGPHHLSPLSQRRGGASAGHFESARRAGALQFYSLPRGRAAPGCRDARPKTGDLLVQEGLSRPGSGNHDLIDDRAEKAPAAATVPEGPVGAPRAEFSSGCRR